MFKGFANPLVLLELSTMELIHHNQNTRAMTMEGRSIVMSEVPTVFADIFGEQPLNRFDLMKPGILLPEDETYSNELIKSHHVILVPDNLWKS